MKHDLKKIIGSAIQRARKSRGFTQNQLAEKLGKSREYLSNVERGVTGLGSFDLISDIECALGVQIDRQSPVQPKPPHQNGETASHNSHIENPFTLPNDVIGLAPQLLESDETREALELAIRLIGRHGKEFHQVLKSLDALTE